MWKGGILLWKGKWLPRGDPCLAVAILLGMHGPFGVCSAWDGATALQGAGRPTKNSKMLSSRGVSIVSSITFSHVFPPNLLSQWSPSGGLRIQVCTAPHLLPALSVQLPYDFGTENFVIGHTRKANFVIGHTRKQTWKLVSDFQFCYTNGHLKFGL